MFIGAFDDDGDQQVTGTRGSAVLVMTFFFFVLGLVYDYDPLMIGRISQLINARSTESIQDFIEGGVAVRK